MMVVDESFVSRRDLAGSDCASVECSGLYCQTGLYNEFGEVVHCHSCGNQSNRYLTKREWLMLQIKTNEGYEQQ